MVEGSPLLMLPPVPRKGRPHGWPQYASEDVAVVRRTRELRSMINDGGEMIVHLPTDKLYM